MIIETSNVKVIKIYKYILYHGNKKEKQSSQFFEYNILVYQGVRVSKLIEIERFFMSLHLGELDIILKNVRN